MRVGFVSVKGIREQLGDKLKFTFEVIGCGIYFAKMEFPEFPELVISLGMTQEAILIDVARTRISTKMYEEFPQTSAEIFMFRRIMLDRRFPIHYLTDLTATNFIDYEKH